MVTVAFIWCFSCFNWFSYCRGNCICAGQGNTVVSHFVVQTGDFTAGKHSCQPFCGPDGRFYCSNSVCSLWPAPFSYLCVRVRILGVLKIVCSWAKPDCCHTPAVVSTLLIPLPVSCPLTTPHHYMNIISAFPVPIRLYFLRPYSVLFQPANMMM